MSGVNKLTISGLKALTKTGRYGDGNGLWLQISKWGTKSWVFRYMLDGRARSMGLGPVQCQRHDGGVTLAEAREQRDRLRKLLREGIDPIDDRQAKRDARRTKESERTTFRQAAERFVDMHEQGWRNAKHRQQWRNTLQSYAFPTLGDRPVSAISGALITEALAPIWQSKPETAQRVKQRIERVLRWTQDGMPLPAPSKTQRVKHHKALPWTELPEFMIKLRALDSVSARALEFTILTAARTGETIGATYDEIDLKARLWVIPAERTKASREHRVPLSERAIEVLSGLPHERGNPHVFIGGRERMGLSNMAMLQCLRGLGDNGLTVHGFRSTFKDWCAETTSYPNIVSEAALAHTIPDKVEKAYRRGDLLEKRDRLMTDWARFCYTPVGRSNRVIRMRGKT